MSQTLAQLGLEIDSSGSKTAVMNLSQLAAAARQRAKKPRAAALARINELERDVQPGLLRAVALGHQGATEKLQALDAEIAELRKALAG